MNARQQCSHAPTCPAWLAPQLLHTAWGAQGALALRGGMAEAWLHSGCSFWTVRIAVNCLHCWPPSCVPSASSPSFSIHGLSLLLAASGHDSRRATQLWRAMYADGRWVRTLDDADSSHQPFAASFKASVHQCGSLAGGLTLQSVSTARDGTHKLIFALHGGPEGAPAGNVETVLIPMRNRWAVKGSARTAFAIMA